MKKTRLADRPLTQFFFFGNYFYGLCTVGLSIEAGLQQKASLNSPAYYFLVFCATVLYYTQAYIATDTPQVPYNARSLWYSTHSKTVAYNRAVLALLCAFCALLYLTKLSSPEILMSGRSCFFHSAFILAALFYYGTGKGILKQISLRNIGWLKPFIIGFVWAGMVTVYPVLFSAAEKGHDYSPDFFSALLFVKNMMFIAVLCIMFDIKDYAMDYNKRLKTFVVNIGLRKTIFYIIIPLSMLGLTSFLIFAVIRGFSIPKILLNVLPFAGIVAVAYSLQSRRSIFYYLFIIDGLMLLKACCGSIAMVFF